MSSSQCQGAQKMASFGPEEAEPSENSLRVKTRSYVIASVLKSRDASKEWRVLVVDDYSSKVLFSACSTYDVMDQGFCLIENLQDNHERSNSPELSVVYFLTPCVDSIATVIQDFSSSPPRYGNCSVYFASELTAEMFEMFQNSPVVPFMRELKEVNIDFLTSESHVFHFDNREGFALCFDDELAELRDPYRQEMSERLTSLCLVLGYKPCQVRYATSTAQLASCTKISLDNLALNTDPSCTMIIVDRSVDMISPLLFEVTYRAMMEDILDAEIVDQFKQTCTNEGASGKCVANLDQQDPVLHHVRHMHIAQSVSWLVGNVNTLARMGAVGKGVPKLTNVSEAGDVMRQIGKYQEFGAKLSVHLDLAQLMMATFKDRKLAQIAPIQQTIATGVDDAGRTVQASKEHERMCRLVQDESIWREDLLRTILIAAASKIFKPSQLDKLLRLGGFKDEDVRAVASMTSIVSKLETTHSSTFVQFGGLSRKNRPKQQSDESFEYSRWTPRLKQLLRDFFANSLDNDQYPRLTIEDSVVQVAKRSSNKMHDPMNGRPTSVTSRIIVFVAGGITYSEIRAIHELMNDDKTEIMLGSTHIIRPNEFVKDVAF